MLDVPHARNRELAQALVEKEADKVEQNGKGRSNDARLLMSISKFISSMYAMECFVMKAVLICDDASNVLVSLQILVIRSYVRGHCFGCSLWPGTPLNSPCTLASSVLSW